MMSMSRSDVQDQDSMDKSTLVQVQKGLHGPDCANNRAGGEI